MTYVRHDKSQIAGALSADTDPVQLVDKAARAAEASFEAYAQTSAEVRAQFLDRIANEIEARGEAITTTAIQETGLPKARLVAERGRTTGQLRMFARFIEAGRHLDIRHDPALPDREPLPRPDLRLMQRPIGPVAVFGASNFPLAFSVAGGDTASALAAGCPVVVKAHSAHPATSEIVAKAIGAAVDACDLPKGVFSLLQAGSRTLGTALVRHPLIKAVGFTGSLAGGRALFDLCVQRPEPIPFFGELGSVNPMFLMPHALDARAEEIGRGWAASLTMGAGQFCTNPGIAFVTKGAAAERFAAAAGEALAKVPAQEMLTPGIADAYHRGIEARASLDDVLPLVSAEHLATGALPDLARVSVQTWRSSPNLAEEIFGPAGLIVELGDASEMEDIARNLPGQLTVTLHLDEADIEAARRLMPVLERLAGRVLANGFPTGVEVCDAMVHGGPYPASTNFGATSVGTMAIRRFLRPVSYQNLPNALLPPDIR